MPHGWSGDFKWRVREALDPTPQDQSITYEVRSKKLRSTVVSFKFLFAANYWPMVDMQLSKGTVLGNDAAALAILHHIINYNYPVGDTQPW